MRESLWSLGMDKQQDSASFSTDPLTSEEEVHWEQESFLLHGFVGDIMSAEEGGTEENKEKCEDKKEKGVRNWITVHYLIWRDESEQTCL